MPRAPLIFTDIFPYHLTNRSNNREWFYIRQPILYEIFKECISRSVELYRVLVHQFVLMDNHYHMLASTPFQNVDEFVRHLQTEVARSVQRESGRINHVFGTRYSWSVLDNPTSVGYVYKYVARNPVRAGLCEEPNQYPFSTANNRRIHANGMVLTEGIDSLWSVIPKEWENRKAWLKIPTSKEAEQLIGKGLRRKVFQFSKGNDVRKTLESLRREYGVERGTQHLSGRKGD